MKVTATHEETIRTIKEAELEIAEITLLSAKEAGSLLTEKQGLSDSYWWLRSPGNYPDCAAYVDCGGKVRAGGTDVDNIDFGVRPALRFSNPESSNLVPGDSFEAGGERWTIIDDNLALCDRIIEKSVFRTDTNAPDANDYEKSDVKTWLENWALEKGIYTTAQLEQMQGRA